MVRGHALYVTQTTPGVGQGAVAERLGIEYESAVEGELLPGVSNKKQSAGCL